MGDGLPKREMPGDLPELPKAFTQALAGHQGRLRGYILSLVADSATADDVLQETNIILCKKAAEYEPGTSFRAWALRVAHFQVLRHRRDKARDRLHFDDELLDQLETEADRETQRYEARRRALLHCLRKLSSQQRRVIVERYLEARAVQEIASGLGRTPNAISLVLFRARQNLADCVARFGSETSKEQGDG